MLHTPSSFPWPGAKALLGTRPVTIIRIESGNRRFVTGKGIARSVDLADLSDALIDGDPVARWSTERLLPVAQTPAAAFTPIDDLYRDFEAFALARGLRRDQLPSRIAFARALGAGGMATIVRRVDGIARRCMPVELRHAPMVDA